MSKVTRREFINDSLLAAAAAAAVPTALSAVEPKANPSANETLRVAVMGVRGRGRSHIGGFNGLKNCEVAVICDADEGVIGPAMQAAPKAKYVRDIRKVLEDKSIDAISVATPNCWHSLATIWAVQAGKNVYVEKPLSHNVYEGRKLVEAQAKYKKVVQHGTQSRSQAATRDAMQYLKDGGMGKVYLSYGCCYKRRGSIGRAEPSKPPASVDYDLWLGPAEYRPFRETVFHYNWHWVYNTGNGDMGNQGVHQMDIARWGLGVDRHPDKVISVGGRLGYEDDGDTANTQIALYDYGDRKLIFETRGLPTPSYMDYVGIGVVFHCEKGYVVSGSYSHLKAYDKDRKEIREFKGGGNNYEVFTNAIRANDPSQVTAPAIEGHLSSALCHLGAASYRIGKQEKLDPAGKPFGKYEEGNEAFRGFCKHLHDNGVNAGTKYSVGPLLSFDGEKEQFTGADAGKANELITREYRKPYVVPDRV